MLTEEETSGGRVTGKGDTEGLQELSVLPALFYYESKTILKNKFY